MANYNSAPKSGELTDFTEWHLDFPSVETFANHGSEVIGADQGRFTHPVVEKFCRDTPGPLLLDEAFYADLTQNNKLVLESVGFTANDSWSTGREDSAHQVQFGNLTLKTTDGGALDVPVAVKPFYSMRRILVNELGAMLKAPELTGVESFEPLGVVQTAGGLALLTKFEEEVVSFDNFSWNRDIAAPMIEEIDTVALLQKAALSLGRLHSNGIVHNDSQVKNIAVAVKASSDPSKLTRTLRLIDLEEARLYDLDDPIDGLRFLDGVRRDTAKFIGTVLDRGLWRNAGYDDRAEALAVLFAEPYMSYMRHPGTLNTGTQREYIAEIEERVKDVLSDV